MGLYHVQQIEILDLTFLCCQNTKWNSLFQVTPVPPDFVSHAKAATQEDYPFKSSGFASTVGSIASQSLQVILYVFIYFLLLPFCSRWGGYRNVRHLPFFVIK